MVWVRAELNCYGSLLLAQRSVCCCSESFCRGLIQHRHDRKYWLTLLDFCKYLSSQPWERNRINATVSFCLEVRGCSHRLQYVHVCLQLRFMYLNSQHYFFCFETNLLMYLASWFQTDLSIRLYHPPPSIVGINFESVLQLSCWRLFEHTKSLTFTVWREFTNVRDRTGKAREEPVGKGNWNCWASKFNCFITSFISVTYEQCKQKMFCFCSSGYLNFLRSSAF